MYVEGNATISERDPVEFLSELRPLTTFLEKTTTSGHICFTVEVDGREFGGYGLTKIRAKQNAAIDALRHTFNIVCTNTGTLFSHSFLTVYKVVKFSYTCSYLSVLFLFSELGFRQREHYQ